MDREDLKDCRMMVTILLPKGADDKEAFKNVPDGALYAADYFKEKDLLDAESMMALGKSAGMAIHRAVKAGRGELN